MEFIIKLEAIGKLVAIATGVFGIAYTIYKGYRVIDRKVIAHDGKLEEHGKKFLEHEERVDKMEDDFKKQIEKIENKFDTFYQENRRSHEILHKEQTEIKVMLSRIDGYISGTEKSAS